MAFLVRRINRKYWPPVGTHPPIDVFDQKIDGLTNCLKVIKRGISVWEIDDVADLHKAILAISAGFTRLETFDVVLLDKEYLKSVLIPLNYTKGTTPVKSLEDSHIDIQVLDYYKLGLVAEHIIQQISAFNLIRHNKTDIQTIVNKAIDEGLVRRDELQPEFADKL